MNASFAEIWPGWETVRLIGRGSFGTVYEIERDIFGQKEKAALKVISIPQSSNDIDELRSNGYDDASITETFNSYLKDIIDEYSLMRKLNGNSNVVNCDDVRYVQHDVGYGWDIYIKMELVTPLVKAIGETVSEEQIIQIGKDICRALILCKQYNIVHRDIKPANIFVSESGNYKLGDFGIAKTIEGTSSGTKIGTYEYMAPEVYLNKPYGCSADLYSLGLVLYWLLNERRTPFLPMPPILPSTSDKESARKLRFEGIPLQAPAHGSKSLKEVVLKACAYRPEDRYMNANEFLIALNNIGSSDTRSTVSKIDTDAPVIGESESLAEGSSTVGVFPPKKTNESSVDSKPKNTIVTKFSAKKWLILGIFAAVIICVIRLVWLVRSNDSEVTTTPSPQESSTVVTSTPKPTYTPVPTATTSGAATQRADFKPIVAGNNHTVGISAEGTVVAVGNNQDGQCNVSDWKKIVSVSAGSRHTVGLREDGTVIATGYNGYGQCDVSSWEHIVAISAGAGHTVGLREDGTVIAVGWNNYGQCKVNDWTDIVAIAADYYHTVGLREDGTVIAVGDNRYGQCRVSEWANITAVATGNYHTLGLCEDGTVVAAGDNRYNRCEVSDWTDIIAISAGERHSVGLHKNGTVIAVGDNDYNQYANIGDWSDIIYITAGWYNTVGLCIDGTVVATGFNDNTQCDVSEWSGSILMNEQ